ncbi:DUF4440 domain-containing protein [Opitutaceae bacterium EW11]|nr:DUF4440 domain-containing protein [Opitutaceae bacterium EW11]
MAAETEVAERIIRMETSALERWGRGDPGGFLAISAPDVVYFDPYLEHRIDGLEALRRRYEEIWGKVRFDRFELIDPKVQFCGSAAVLTFNYVSYAAGQCSRWNCTEVYRKTGDSWEIVQTHWSYTTHPGIVGATDR